MTCVCYGADAYEGCSAPLKICATVDEAKAWWSDQAERWQALLRLDTREPCEGHHDIYCIAEFADTGVIYHYEREGNRNRGPKTWRIRETKENPA